LLTSTSTNETKFDNLSSASKSQCSEAGSQISTYNMPNIISAISSPQHAANNDLLQSYTEVMANSDPHDGKDVTISAIDWSSGHDNQEIINIVEICE